MKKYATNTKSIIVKPNNPLNFETKKKITLKYLKEKQTKLKDKHQVAALYAALIAYKNFKALFIKIDKALVKKNMKYLSSKIKIKVLSERTPIHECIRIFERSY